MRTSLLVPGDADLELLPLLPAFSELLHLRDRASHHLGSDAVISVLDSGSCSLASVLSMYCCLLALLIFTLHRLCSRICIHFELKCTLQIYILFLYFLFVLRHCFHRVVCLCSILLDFLHPL